MPLLKEYERYLSKSRYRQDKLKTASSIDEAKDNIIQLHTIESNLFGMERRLIAELEQMQFTLQHKKGKGLASSLFQRSKRKEQEHEQKNLMRRIDHYKRMLTGVNAMRSVVGQVTIPKLKKYIAQNKFEQSESKPLDYREYIRSDEWKKRAEEAKARVGNRCQVCNRSRTEVQLDAHHRTYEYLGNERPEDITVLCRDCHQLYEDKKKARKLTKVCKKCGKSFTPLKPSYYYCSSCYRSKHRTKYQSRKTSETLTIKEEFVQYSTTSKEGFCIRCHKQIKSNPESPYCYPCFKNWKRYENQQYKEKFCHICGREHKASMSKPTCLSCYRKHR